VLLAPSRGAFFYWVVGDDFTSIGGKVRPFFWVATAYPFLSLPQTDSQKPFLLRGLGVVIEQGLNYIFNQSPYDIYIPS
jgi:hypothetical protein